MFTTPIPVIEKHFGIDQETGILVRVSADLRASSAFQSLEDHEIDAKKRMIMHHLHNYGLPTSILNRIVRKLMMAN
jgi:hypothetical protein